MTTIDCRGLPCPKPVIQTEAALQAATSPFVVIVDDDAAAANVRRFAEGQGARVSAERRGPEHHLTIEPGPVQKAALARDLVVFLSSEVLGRGDDDLGAALMATFLDTLSHFQGELSHILLINGGAKLPVEGSPVLEELRQLSGMGVCVLVCGTCLRHFGLVEKLGVGRISNMMEILEILARAGRVLSP